MRALMLLTAASLLPGLALGQDRVTRWPADRDSYNALSSACEYLGHHAVDLGIAVDYRDVKESYEREARERGADSFIWFSESMAGLAQYYDCSDARDEIGFAANQYDAQRTVFLSLDETYSVHIIVWRLVGDGSGRIDDVIASGSLPIRYSDYEVCLHVADELQKAFTAAPGTEVDVSCPEPVGPSLRELVEKGLREPVENDTPND